MATPQTALVIIYSTNAFPLTSCRINSLWTKGKKNLFSDIVEALSNFVTVLNQFFVTLSWPTVLEQTTENKLYVQQRQR